MPRGTCSRECFTKTPSNHGERTGIYKVARKSTDWVADINCNGHKTMQSPSCAREPTARSGCVLFESGVIEMRTNATKRRGTRLWLAMLGLGAAVLGTGCQVDMAGQTLPSPWYLTDDVQYFPPGPEFLLANEAAAMAEQAEEITSEPQ